MKDQGRQTRCVDPYGSGDQDGASSADLAPKAEGSADLIGALVATGVGRWEALGLAASAFGNQVAGSEWGIFLDGLQHPQQAVLALDGIAVTNPQLSKKLLNDWLGNRVADGWVDLSDRPWVTSLPDGLMVKGELSLRGCAGLERLPQNLVVQGRMDVSDCPNLVEIPNGVRVIGDFLVKRCASLRRVGERVKVDRGEMRLDDCPALTEIGSGLDVWRGLSLKGCISLIRLPGRLHLNGTLDLSDCSTLTHIPTDTHVEGSLIAERCHALVEVGMRVQVKYSMVLRGCGALEHLSDGLEVGGELDLRGCRNIQLPRRIRVGGGIRRG